MSILFLCVKKMIKILLFHSFRSSICANFKLQDNLTFFATKKKHKSSAPLNLFKLIVRAHLNVNDLVVSADFIFN